MFMKENGTLHLKMDPHHTDPSEQNKYQLPLKLYIIDIIYIKFCYQFHLWAILAQLDIIKIRKNTTREKNSSRKCNH